ncbi:cobalamin-dependent protein [Aquibacillus saliphilus]|uniref:cobalamin-dependent protein n=1 Tax=Aquibacillus saliphilus TaxID=1909422 RepID=UPI001CEFBA83|nr:cobalamin-dependent protein [Aquibacillus saliphilus]
MKKVIILIEPIRVLIAKVGLDGHDRGALILTQVLRESGMTVYYTGIRKTPTQISEMAVRNQIDVIGISILSGGHRYLIPKVIAVLEQSEAGSIPIIIGGIIPVKDREFLTSKGVTKIFIDNESSTEIVKYIAELVHRNR